MTAITTISNTSKDASNRHRNDDNDCVDENETAMLTKNAITAMSHIDMLRILSTTMMIYMGSSCQVFRSLPADLRIFFNMISCIAAVCIWPREHLPGASPSASTVYLHHSLACLLSLSQTCKGHGSRSSYMHFSVHFLKFSREIKLKGYFFYYTTQNKLIIFRAAFILL